MPPFSPSTCASAIHLAPVQLFRARWSIWILDLPPSATLASTLSAWRTASVRLGEGRKIASSGEPSFHLPFLSNRLKRSLLFSAHTQRSATASANFAPIGVRL
jgi:hypothetical protein